VRRYLKVTNGEYVRNIYSFAILIAIAVGVTRTKAQTTAPIADGDTVLQVDVLSERQHMAEVLTQSLRAATVPGGVVSLTGCHDQVEVSTFIPRGSTLGDALGRLIASDRQDWRVIYTGAVVNILPQGDTPDVLKSRIDRIEIPQEESLVLAVQRILDAPAVKAAIRDLGLQALPPTLGYSSFGGAEDLLAQETPLVVENATVLEVLNALAASRESAIWLYEQQSCPNGSTQFRLDFVKR
jgi:hypothetical protein